MTTSLVIDKMENGYMVTVTEPEGPKSSQGLMGLFAMEQGPCRLKRFVFESLEDALVFSGRWFEANAHRAEVVS